MTQRMGPFYFSAVIGPMLMASINYKPCSGPNTSHPPKHNSSSLKFRSTLAQCSDKRSSKREITRVSSSPLMGH